MISLKALWREWTLTPTHKELLPKMCCRPGRHRKEILTLAGDRALIDQITINKYMRDDWRWLAYDTSVYFTMNMSKNHQGEWIDIGSVTARSRAGHGSSLIHGHEPRVFEVIKPKSNMIIVDAWEFARLLKALPLQKNRDPDYMSADVREFIDGFLAMKQTTITDV